MATFRYHPPAEHNDFAGHPQEDARLQAWSELIAERFTAEVQALNNTLGQTPLFFTELEHSLDVAVPTAAVPWVGFPRIHQLQAAGDRARMLRAAETRGQRRIGFTDRALTQAITQPFRRQDEYLEWVPITEGGRVVKYAFTAEGPEYWEFLAEQDRAIVLNLYTAFAGRPVRWDEIAWPQDVWGRDPRSGRPVRLYNRGDYNPYNAVNLEECAAHLTHPANTLGAEINLAARATVQRADAAGNLVTERRRLACCSDFGDPNRNSDPLIGAAVNQSVRGGTSLTLANPVALYIQRFDSSRVADTHGNALPGWWRILRGTANRGLRAEFGPPAGSALTLEDVRIGNNEPLTSGGQLAELITMVLYARALNLGVPEPTPRRCVNRCCVQQGQAPDRSLLAQVESEESCPPGWVNAFTELGQPAPLSPFARRLAGRGPGEADNGD